MTLWHFVRRAVKGSENTLCKRAAPHSHVGLESISLDDSGPSKCSDLIIPFIRHLKNQIRLVKDFVKWL